MVIALDPALRNDEWTNLRRSWYCGSDTAFADQVCLSSGRPRRRSSSPVPPSRRKGRPATDEDRACSIEVALSDNDEDCMDFSLYGHRNKKEADESSTEPQRCLRGIAGSKMSC